jgi:XTP/dITP diphosphohydrolase
VRLIFASRNPDKISELSDALAGLPLSVSGVADIPGVPAVEETGATLEENALLKARAVHRATGELCLADDTGLEVDALGGAPGVRSARFGGPEQSYEKNLRKLLESLAGIPEQRRGARFRTVVALVLPDGTEMLAEGVCEGLILASPRGGGGFGYDPVFHYPQAGKTFSEMSLEEKQAVSHRGRAMRQVRVILEKLLSDRASVGPS